MATNKERIEQLEAGLGGLQDGMSRMELGLTDKLHQMEETIHRLSEALLSNKEGSSSNTNDRNGRVRNNRDNSKEQMEGGQQMFLSKLAKLEFPRVKLISDGSGYAAPTVKKGKKWRGQILKRNSGLVLDLQSEIGCKDGHKKALVGTFMGSLKSEIADDIWMFKPKSLKEAISLARMRDDQLTRQRRFTRPLQPNCPQPDFSSQMKSKPTLTMKRPQLLLLEGNSIPNKEDDIDEEIEEPAINEQTEPEISFHALTGWSTPKPCGLQLRLGQHEVVVLIDSGSTHNFISEKVADMLHLPVVPTKPFTVKVANGTPLKCQGRFEHVHVILQGVQWLEQLGIVVCNWKKLTMVFQWENQTHKLQGTNTQIIQVASLKVVSKELRQGSSMFAIYLQSTSNEVQQAIHLDIQQLIKAFEDIFQEPNQLPPAREIDHQITLKEGTEPVNVRPYRYAYFQKAEIEKQVRDMLKLGLIRASTSPFSSPVLLVKKKDGTWCFCTDYRALNAVTIKDRFPIPTVDDMLDELHKATYFTKLDLRASYHQVWVHPPDIPKTAFRTHNGLTGYYRKFVRNYGIIAWALTNLLKKGQFAWTKDAETAFQALKQTMTSTPTLAMPNFNEPLIIESDASGDGIGVVLTQQGKPIAFMSRALGVSKRSWTKVLYPNRSKKPQILARATNSNTEVARMGGKIVGYDYEITYKLGRENSVAYALSRVVSSPSLNALFVPQAPLWDEIKAEAIKHPYMDKISKLATDNPGAPYTWRNGLVCYKNRVDYVSSCDVCQRVKSETLAPAGLLQPLPIPCLVWDDITMDFIEGLPTSNGKNTILVVSTKISPPEMQYYANSRPIYMLLPIGMKQVADSKRRNIEYQVGDMVFLKLQLYRQQSVFCRASQKLASRFYGPYQIEQRIGKVKKGSRIFEESLVKWKRLPLDDATWEDTKMLRDRFINVNLEDKVPVQDRGIDEPRRLQCVPKKNPRFIT
ncbi:Retrovirus-related Pol polyprotein from transposon 17.6 [Vitis vinifera]|uniref:Retrovirus-related Pol polyprotein from transposon 17.6 n=1 Tax=Vitis vinifera TaxID=29760 RepID=A0A438FSX2_VITVI|nr:Retrovirus-related Pol polyprotein from transposon 17.6 [Vitis vinifera]